MTYRNVPKATLQGVEFYGSHELGKNIFMNFGYTYLDAKDKTGGTRLTDRAKHQLLLGYLINRKIFMPGIAVLILFLI